MANKPVQLLDDATLKGLRQLFDAFDHDRDDLLEPAEVGAILAAGTALSAQARAAPAASSAHSRRAHPRSWHCAVGLGGARYSHRGQACSAKAAV